MRKWRSRTKSESTNASAATNSNLIDPKPYKDIILSKISCAVTYTMLFHFLFILLYVVIVNHNFMAPEVWLRSILYSISCFSFWIYILPVVVLIFFKTALSSKSLLTKTNEGSSTLRELISGLSVKIIFLVLHIIGGGFVVWLYLSLSEDQYSALYSKCDGHTCMQEGGLFLILNGAWNGLYFYLRTQSSHKMLLFPVIQQSKFCNFKAEFFTIVNESKWFALYPTIYFTLLYHCLSSIVYQICLEFGVEIQHQQFGIPLYFLTWVFSTVYVIHANVFEFLFKLFLTEQIRLPLTRTDKNAPSLADALSLDTVPILQQLASLDLYLLSLWSPERRQMLYALSQPGGHPYTWNQLIDVILMLVNNFTESLNNNMEAISTPDLVRPQNTSTHKNFDATLTTVPVPMKYLNIRSSQTSSIASIAEIQTNDSLQVQQTIYVRLMKILSDLYGYFKNIGIIKQIFGTSKDAKIQDILKSGQSMELMISALGNIVVESVREDPYGVIQRDVPDIIASLFQLKIALERLNKSSILLKKNSSHSSVKLSNSVYGATKRSLIKICRRFRNYLHEFNLKKETVGQLRSIF
ncbi:hypothetical protein PPYR_04977 [Photinus pyralis]|uniref:Nucleoporin NDC1 n=1 Tax=Photinus pyralis TaxID=7054 RepID=A0A1Y1ND98_PHOPY|nr:nucleoporin Ndc1 [Photinus pyralis]KAB0802791.1 hypothetical protein PPYR_04977 [Photinus pyralis]